MVQNFSNFTRNWIPDKEASFSTSLYPNHEPSGLFKLNDTMEPDSLQTNWKRKVATYIRIEPSKSN